MVHALYVVLRSCAQLHFLLFRILFLFPFLCCVVVRSYAQLHFLSFGILLLFPLLLCLARSCAKLRFFPFGTLMLFPFHRCCYAFLCSAAFSSIWHSFPFPLPFSFALMTHNPTFLLIHLSVCLSVCLSVRLSHMSIYPSLISLSSPKNNNNNDNRLRNVPCSPTCHCVRCTSTCAVSCVSFAVSKEKDSSSFLA
jgi:hypothetical protein